MRKAGVALALAGLAALGLSGCAKPWEGTDLDEWSWYACDDFASAMYNAGGAKMAYQLTPAGRETFVGTMRQAIGAAEHPKIKDAGTQLGELIIGPEAAWMFAMDTMAAACLEAGWQAS